MGRALELLDDAIPKFRTRVPCQRATEDTPLRLRVDAALSGSDFAFCREAALAGGGIALLPTMVVKRDVAEGKLVAVLKDYVLIEGAVYLVHAGSRLLPLKVRVFRDFILAAFSAKCAGKRPRPSP